MRKWRNRALTGLVVALAAGLLLSVSGCSGGKDWTRSISKALDADVSQGEIVSAFDDHEGNGDGFTHVELQFPAGTELQAPGSHELPLPQELEIAVWGGELDTDGTPTSWGPLKAEDAPDVPSVEHGWYWFYDFNNPDDPSDPSGLLSRYSFNFILAIYDSDQSRLYYLKMDT